MAESPTSPSSSAAEPDRVIHRNTARVLPVDPQGRVLLMHGWDPARPGEPFWFTIGGGVEPGESLSDAAVRELFEETGLRTDGRTLGESFATHEHRFGWDGMTLVQNETYFAMATSFTEVSFAGMEAIELDTTDSADWWTPDALDADGSAGFPQLTEFMRMAFRAVMGPDHR